MARWLNCLEVPYFVGEPRPVAKTVHQRSPKYATGVNHLSQPIPNWILGGFLHLRMLKKDLQSQHGAPKVTRCPLTQKRLEDPAVWVFDILFDLEFCYCLMTSFLIWLIDDICHLFHEFFFVFWTTSMISISPRLGDAEFLLRHNQCDCWVRTMIRFRPVSASCGNIVGMVVQNLGLPRNPTFYCRNKDKILDISGSTNC